MAKDLKQDNSSTSQQQQHDDNVGDDSATKLETIEGGGTTHRGQGGSSEPWLQRKVGEAAANELETIQVQDGINESQSDMRDALAAKKIQGSQWELVSSRTHQGRNERDLELESTSTWIPAYNSRLIR